MKRFLFILFFYCSFSLADVFEGYTLFTISSFSPGSNSTTYSTQLIDNDYNIINEWESLYRPASMAYLLPDSTLLYPCQQENYVINGVAASGGRIIKYDWDGNVLWDWQCNENYQLHHDIEPLPNGNILAIAMEEISPGITPDVVLEISPLGLNSAEIVWEWHTWDHRGSNNPHKFDELAPYDTDDWNHFNAIHINNEFNKIYLSSRNWSEFYIIEWGTDGDILYRWGNPQNYGRGTENDKVLDANHGVNEIAIGYPGENNILIFNNRTPAPGGGDVYSSILEIIPPLDENGNYYIGDDEPFGPDQIYWQYESDFHSPRQSGAFRLLNGNTFITDANDGYLFEVTNTGEVVWEYQAPDNNQINRALKYGIDYLQVLGDLNSDGGLNILDITILISYILNSQYNLLGDLNNDQLLNVSDVIILINLILDF